MASVIQAPGGRMLTSSAMMRPSLRLEQLDVEEALAHVERLEDLAAGLLDRRVDVGPADIAHVAVAG